MCHRLGPAELAYRQVVVNIDRALRYGELIPKRHRNLIEAALQHGDARVRAYASHVISRDAQVRRELADASHDDAVIEVSRSEPIELEETWMSEDIPF